MDDFEHAANDVQSKIQSAEFNDTTKEPFIYVLADDILAYIFLLNASGDPTGYTDLSRRELEAATMASSQVCARWRSVALGYPRIWACIINYIRHSPRWINELLRRSDPSPLDFGSRIHRIDLSIRNDRALHDSERIILGLVMNYSSRLRTFSSQVTPSCWELVHSRFLRQPAPNLEFVNFCVLFNSVEAVTDPLFQGHAPSLRNLHLRRCAVDFTSHTLTPLTELYVHQITRPNAAPTVIGWLHFLREMPSLRWITIIDAISGAGSRHIDFPAVHLDKLEMLRIEGGFHESVVLINQLAVPPRCGLRLSCDNARLGFDQRLLCDIIEGKLDSWGDTQTRDCRFIAIHREHSMIIGNLDNIDAAWEISAAEVMYRRKLVPDPVLTVKLQSHDPEDITPLFLTLFTLFERIFVTTTHLVLWITSLEGENGTEIFLPLIDSFRSFVNLKSLNVIHDSHSFLFPLLQRIPPVLFPALQALYFLRGHFRQNSDSVAQVAAFIRWRIERGYPVEKVNICQSRVDREFVLSQLGDVEVDMNTWNDSDTDSDEET